MHTHQAQPRQDIGAPPPTAVAWLAETEIAGETRCAIVWSQLASEARRKAAPVLEQPLHEHVHVKQVTFKGFSLKESS